MRDSSLESSSECGRDDTRPIRRGFIKCGYVRKATLSGDSFFTSFFGNLQKLFSKNTFQTSFHAGWSINRERKRATVKITANLHIFVSRISIWLTCLLTFLRIFFFLRSKYQFIYIGCLKKGKSQNSSSGWKNNVHRVEAFFPSQDKDLLGEKIGKLYPLRCSLDLWCKIAIARIYKIMISENTFRLVIEIFFGTLPVIQFFAQKVPVESLVRNSSHVIIIFTCELAIYGQNSERKRSSNQLTNHLWYCIKVKNEHCEKSKKIGGSYQNFWILETIFDYTLSNIVQRFKISNCLIEFSRFHLQHVIWEPVLKIRKLQLILRYVVCTYLNVHKIFVRIAENQNWASFQCKVNFSNSLWLRVWYLHAFSCGLPFQ